MFCTFSKCYSCLQLIFMKSFKKKQFLNRYIPDSFPLPVYCPIFSKRIKKRVKYIINLPQGSERELWLGLIIASFINQDPEWLHQVTKRARVEVVAGTDVSCLPGRLCYHSQGVDQSSRLLISHLPLATSHEHKYFVGILSWCSLCARLPSFFFVHSPF